MMLSIITESIMIAKNWDLIPLTIARCHHAPII